jgi:hypothetical protein
MRKNRFGTLKNSHKLIDPKVNQSIEASFYANQFHIMHVDKMYNFFTDIYLTKNEDVLHVSGSNEYFVRNTEASEAFFRSLLKPLEQFDKECEIEEIRFYKAGLMVKGGGIINLEKVRNDGYRVIFNFRASEKSAIGSYVEMSAVNLGSRICSRKSYSTVLVPSMSEIKLYTGTRVPGSSIDVSPSLYLIIDFKASSKFTELCAVNVHNAQIEGNGGLEGMLTKLASKMANLGGKMPDLTKNPALKGHSKETIEIVMNMIKNGLGSVSSPPAES